MDNIETFSLHSDQYARYRPSFPKDLFVYLNDLVERHDLVWDCATGNGQAAVTCADFFTRIEATDISEKQIRHRITHPRITYRVCSAEHTPFRNNSFDLVIVAQALHWFNLEQFYPEAVRVLKPGGVLAVWGYGFIAIQPNIDNVIAESLLEPIDQFWADGNRQLMAGYRTIPFPFHEIFDLPSFFMRSDWNLNQLLEYLRTWSAVKRYSAELGSDPVDQLEERLKPIWKLPDEVRQVQMPLFLRVGRVPA